MARIVLQPVHLGRQFGDVLLRPVDDGEPFFQIAHGRFGRLRRLLQPLADPLGHVVQTLLQLLGDLALLGLQGFRHPGLGGRLALGDLGQPAGELLLAGGQLLRHLGLTPVALGDHGVEVGTAPPAHQEKPRGENGGGEKGGEDEFGSCHVLHASTPPHRAGKRCRNPSVS
ncbi:MAG: hypothetical protein ACMVO3_01180 [Thalassobaculum sp.]